MSRKTKWKNHIDNHNTIRLADQFKSLYISILSRDVLNKIQKPDSEWRWPRNIRYKFQKDKDIPMNKNNSKHFVCKIHI